ncbi:hypothetical protein [Nocardioides sp. SYSU DS0663]|uniref:hypothetical protein n=1 Tax=Nocardioides sp. SYSU DS0663 TaxID=3416445 RepID=UPI003F4AFE0B
MSALLDGQLDPVETERAWAHVHTCHSCRDLVEREGWVKTRLAGLSFASSEEAPASLKGALRGGAVDGAGAGLPPGDAYLVAAQAAEHRGRRTAGVVALGGGAVGAAVLGVIALGAAPADVPQIDRRSPITQIGSPSSGPTPSPTPTPTPTPARAPTSTATPVSTPMLHRPQVPAPSRP